MWLCLLPGCFVSSWSSETTPPPKEIEAKDLPEDIPALIEFADTRITAAVSVQELAIAVLPRSRSEEKSGVRWLPDGEEVYARAIRRHTSLDMAPLDIHNIGLEEIARLEGEYRELGRQVLGTSHLDEIYDRLRNDPELRLSLGVAAYQRVLRNFTSDVVDHQYLGLYRKLQSFAATV